ncbi:S-adenosyl-L-methionine-dependent methyltransferase [Endogone sp. FLAS-F59071]|nr:S-adenosyl-L-methionine-dependent methyltransferase [Endogone sp. FLAS-F59071]|eukprot:RUS20071.1 S-adenosyl-L-methionine-dependent methyltransferase [Endogone sp. FLAS-F59071]
MGQQLSKMRKRIKRPTAPAKPPEPIAQQEPGPDLPPGIRRARSKKDSNPTYPLPNNAFEVNRLNLQHSLTYTVFKSHFMSPIKDDLRRGIRVLDVGCGTGIWSVELAAEYPDSTFVGTDITDMFMVSIPTAPTNCRFQQADTLKGLPFPDGSFDFVFQRYHMSAFREAGWPGIIDELARLVAPGGWLELVDTNGQLYEGGPWETEAYTRMATVLSLRGIEPLVVDKFGEMLDAKGFESVGRGHRPVPVGWGPEEIGEASARNLIALFTSIKPTVVLVLGMSDQQYDDMVAGVGEEFNTYRGFWNAQFTYGRKPLPADE